MLRTLLDQLAFFLKENNVASKLLLPVASFSVPGTPPGAALVALPKRPLASCRCLKEVGVLPLANLEKIRRSGWQVWPKDDRSGESTYFSRAENDVGGVVFLAARLSLLVPNDSSHPADASTILTFFPYSFLSKSRRQKTHTG